MFVYLSDAGNNRILVNLNNIDYIESLSEYSKIFFKGDKYGKVVLESIDYIHEIWYKNANR